MSQSAFFKLLKIEKDFKEDGVEWRNVRRSNCLITNARLKEKKYCYRSSIKA